MRKILFALLVAAMAAVPAASANAQSSGAREPEEPGEPRTEAQSPNITVEEDRLVCKRRVRTGTRMGTNRVCRTQQEWDAQAAAEHKDIEAAADSLSVLSEAATTGDLGGMSDSGDGPLGPR